MNDLDLAALKRAAGSDGYPQSRYGGTSRHVRFLEARGLIWLDLCCMSYRFTVKGKKYLEQHSGDKHEY